MTVIDLTEYVKIRFPRTCGICGEDYESGTFPPKPGARLQMNEQSYHGTYMIGLDLCPECAQKVLGLLEQVRRERSTS